MLNAHHTAKEIGEARPRIAVLGIGAIEQHSHHLPVGTDWLAVRELARWVAEGLGAYLLPALPFSMSQCHGVMAGTVWLRPRTLAKVVRDIVLSLREQAICRIVLINGHGGNFVLEAVVRELNLSYPELMVVMPTPSAGPEDVQVFEPAGPEIHAGQVETSYQLYLNPDHVKEQRTDYIPPVGREFLDYAVMEPLSPHGVWGMPSLGSAEKGRLAMEARAKAIIAHAHQLFSELSQRKGGPDAELA
jgi:creatinine amidohydrolase